MTARRNFQRLQDAERLRAGRSTDPQDITTGPRRDRSPLRGCRDHWDGAPFPVTVRRVGDETQADQAEAA